MSELTKKVRADQLRVRSRVQSSVVSYEMFDPNIIELCDAHERLETAIDGTGDTAILTTNVLRWPAEERITFARHLLGSEWKSPEHERLEAERAAVSTDLEGVTMMLANASFGLRRLEVMLRAWVNARGDDESEASKDLWAEGFRLAKETT